MAWYFVCCAQLLFLDSSAIIRNVYTSSVDCTAYLRVQAFEITVARRHHQTSNIALVTQPAMLTFNYLRRFQCKQFNAKNEEKRVFLISNSVRFNRDSVNFHRAALIDMLNAAYAQRTLHTLLFTFTRLF